MALETGTNFTDLVVTNPTASDSKSQGDDHIRLIKTIIAGTLAAIGTVAAGATADLSTSPAMQQSITGDTAITSFGTGTKLLRFVNFTGKPVITYNATSLITPTGANIQAAPGDTAVLRSDASGNWTVLSYTPYGGIKETTFTATPGNGTYVQMASLPLKTGKWKLGAALNSRAASINDLRCAISNTSASSSGAVAGVTDFSHGPATTTGIASLVMPISTITLTADATWYFNAKNDSGAPSFTGSFFAERCI